MNTRSINAVLLALALILFALSALFSMTGCSSPTAPSLVSPLASPDARTAASTWTPIAAPGAEATVAFSGLRVSIRNDSAQPHAYTFVLWRCAPDDPDCLTTRQAFVFAKRVALAPGQQAELTMADAFLQACGARYQPDVFLDLPPQPTYELQSLLDARYVYWAPGPGGIVQANADTCAPPEPPPPTGSCVPAQGPSALRLGVQIGGPYGPTKIFDFVDGGATDQDPREGVVRHVGAIDGFELNTLVGLSRPASGSATQPRLHLNVLSRRDDAPGELPIEVWLTDVGFAGAPGTATLTSHAGGSSDDREARLQAYLDPSNVPFGTACTSGPQGFNSSLTTTCPISGPFSLTLVARGSIRPNRGWGFDFDAGVSALACQ